MKIIFTFLLLIVCFSKQLSAQGSLSSGLVLYLPFNGNTLDMSGNSNHAINYGASLAPDASGRANCAYSFNGSSDYMRILNSVSLQIDSNISLCAKVKVNGFYTGTCFGNSIIKKGDADFRPGSYGLRFSSPSAGCSFFDATTQNYVGFFNSSYPSSIADTKPYIDTNKWDCIVYTYDGSMAKMYVNGVFRHQYASSSLIGKNVEDLFLGHMDNVSFPYWFNGIMDDVRIYKRVLSASEVSAYCGFVAATNSIKANFKDSSTSCFSKQFTDLSTVSSTAIKLWFWDFGDGGKSTLKNPSHVYSAAGTYNVKLKVVDSNGFSDSITKPIVVGSYKFANAGNDTIVCSQSGSVSIMLNAKGGVSYLWTPAVGLSNVAIPNPIATITATSSYIVTVKDANGCEDIDTITITIKPGSLNLLASPKNIQGCVGEEIQLTASGAKYYKWFPSAGLDKDNVANPKLSLVSSFTYLVVGTDSLGCADQDSITVIAYRNPILKVTSDNTKTDCTEKSVLLTATGALNYSWTPAIYCETSNAATTKARPPATTVFTVRGVDENGCIGEDTITVFYEGKSTVKVPNAFTPNNDGINDKIKPIIVCDFEMTEFSIYTRWGYNVFTSYNINTAWDGNSNGKPCDMNTYYYYLKGKNSKGEDVLFKGDIILLR